MKGRRVPLTRTGKTTLSDHLLAVTGKQWLIRQQFELPRSDGMWAQVEGRANPN